MVLLLATEASEGLGHIAPWKTFVLAALKQGIDVHMVVPDLAKLDDHMGQCLDMNLWQAPLLWPALAADVATPKSWPEILVSLGYGNAACLTGAVKAWVNILRSLRPEVVLADYAPAVQIAARIMRIPVVEVGSGFCVPPLLKGPQSLPGVRHIDPAALAAASAALTCAFNSALQACGSGELVDAYGDMAGWPMCRVVTSPPELDHYGVRADILYSGFLGGQPSAVVGAKNKQIIGYLKPATPHLDVLIAQLVAARVDAHLVIPGCTAAMAGQRGSVLVSPALVDLPLAMQRANVYLSNGGLHGVGQALHAGCWPVVVPMQAEQVAMARQLVLRKWGDIWMHHTALKLPRPMNSWFDAPHCKTPLLANAISAEQRLLTLVKTISEA